MIMNDNTMNAVHGLKTEKPTITVAGLGPGHPDYITPAVITAARSADVLAGGARHFEALVEAGVELPENRILIGSGHPLAEGVEDMLKAALQGDNVCAVVSGDTGFYSLLTYLKKKTDGLVSFDVIPGISSLQYFFARLALTWQDAKLTSMHGRGICLEALLTSGQALGLLTDQHHTAAYAGECMQRVCPERVLYVGENLSYTNERITRLTPTEAIDFIHSDMAVLIIPEAEECK